LRNILISSSAKIKRAGQNIHNPAQNRLRKVQFEFAQRALACAAAVFAKASLLENIFGGNWDLFMNSGFSASDFPPENTD
jgi:hypothetical protein